MISPAVTIPVDLTNPGQFFACCGLLELASQLDEEAEGWFEVSDFVLRMNFPFGGLVDALRRATVTNTMSAAQTARLEKLSAMSNKRRE